MSKDKFTPGPWEVGKMKSRLPMMHDLRIEACGSTPDRVKPIAVLCLQGIETEANAKLISMAPELKETIIRYKEAKEKIKTKYQLVKAELVDSNKRGFDDIWSKGFKKGLQTALEYLKT